MRLTELLKGIENIGTVEDREIVDIVSDSRKVRKGSLYVCIKGRKFDGHTAVKAALENGAAAVVVEHSMGLDGEILVCNARASLAKLCQNFFCNPQEKLTLIAVTGTNGKTTVSSTVKQALESLGYKAGLIGTIRCEIGDMIIPAKFTTPEPWDINALFARMVSAGCSHCVLEASSQALDQGRLLGIDFACGIFTNLTEDHLDYHGTMEEYYEAKKLLFTSCKSAVINLDDEYGKRLLSELKIPTVTFSSRSDTASYTAKSVEFSAGGVKFAINGDGFLARCSFAIPGMYSVDNAMAAFCALVCVEIDKAKACEAVSSAKGVIGRCEVLYNGDFTIICDYAHTADGLDKLLSSLKPFVKGRLITLFGCAGDRDPKKRPAMAQAVCKYSDFVVLSSDNPRSEDPLKIINEMLSYVEQSGVAYTAVPDRFYAIHFALEMLEKDDVLALCGKGHEDYQVIDGCTIYLDEHRLVADFIDEHNL
ncbi:MAG: UDP-N-acetylmuramoyl-L-alanyl-D-glutamate--2,6-diaminopimelate ligase [Oscillospiraceae bacterium]